MGRPAASTGNGLPFSNLRPFTVTPACYPFIFTGTEEPGVRDPRGGSGVLIGFFQTQRLVGLDPDEFSERRLRAMGLPLPVARFPMPG